MDYNKLMEELDKEVLGSFGKSFLTGKSATEGYDEVERDLMATLDHKKPMVEVEGEDDLIFEDDGESPQAEEPSPEEIFSKAVNDYFTGLVNDGIEAEEAVEKVLDVVNSVLPSTDGDSMEESAEEDLGSWLAARKLRKMNRKGLAEDATDEEKAEFKDKQERLKLRAKAGAVNGESPNATQRILDETRKEGQQRNAQRTNEIKAKKRRDSLRADLMDKLGLSDVEKLKEFLGKAGFSSTESLDEEPTTVELAQVQERVNTSETSKQPVEGETISSSNFTEDPEKQKEIFGNTVKELSDKMDMNKAPGSANESASFEEYQKDKEAKMLQRYKQLANTEAEKKKVAIEGMGEIDLCLDEQAISRVSGEYGYSGKNLKKMVAEAIQKGVI